MVMTTETLLEQRIATELRNLRKTTHTTLSEVADLFGWEKAAIHKIESGITRVRLSDYLTLMQHYRPFIPGHPGVSLLDHFTKPMKRTKA